MVILYFGLRPKGFDPENQVHWLAVRNGIRVGQYNLCYAADLFKAPHGRYDIPSEFSIEMALRPQSTGHDGFKFIMVMHSGRDTAQVLVGQWQASLVVMDGDDYDNSRKTKKIYVNDALPSQAPRFLTIATGKAGTRVYIDGELIKERRDLFLKIPSGPNATTLILGNSVNGRHAWSGEIYGFALYPYACEADQVRSHFQSWMAGRTFGFAQTARPALLYTFQERSGYRALDTAGRARHLDLPAKMRILHKEILLPPGRAFEFTQQSVQDMVLNLLGFIPFAMALGALIRRIGPWPNRQAAWLSVAVCFAISLTIELLQAGMPSRSSQLLDLILNTIGAGIGVLSLRLFYKHPLVQRKSI
jgi:hypothetical protein